MNKKGIVRVVVNNGQPPIVHHLLEESEKLAFVDAAWGILQFVDADGQKHDTAFFAKYRSEPGSVGSFAQIVFRFDFGHQEGFAVSMDGKSIHIANILRLCFFARTDRGTVLVSFCPAIAEDAQEYVSVFSNRKRTRILAQHLATAWLHEIWATEQPE